MKKKWLLLPAVLLLTAGLFIFGCNEDNGNGPDVITYTAAANNGKLHKENTTIITLTFSKLVGRGTLTTEHVTIRDGTGRISNYELLNANADTRNLRNIVVEVEGTVIISVNYKGIDPAPKEVMVYKKLGYVKDDSITVNDVIKVAGDKIAGEKITFARYDGEPTAIIPPRTTEPITGISPESPAFYEELVIFDPPLDLRTTNFVEFRWVDMVWEGFDDDGEYNFEAPSTVPPTNNDRNPYNDTRYDLHNVQFYLDMTTVGNDTIRFGKTSETNTSTKAKQPVRFEKNNITGSGTQWDEGHQIKSISLMVHAMQLRSPHNGHWPPIKGETTVTDPETGVERIDGARNPVIEDTYILSLSIDFKKPPPSIVLYDRENGGWNATYIKNPKMGMDNYVFDEPCGEAVCSAPLTHSRSAADPKGLLVRDSIPSRIIWDPIDISVPEGNTPYSYIRASVAATSLSWYGFGVISSTRETGMPLKADDVVIRMNFNPGGSGGNTVWNIPFEHVSYAEDFYWERFCGLFVQGNDDGEIQLNILRIE